MNFDEVPWDWQATATLRWSAGKLQQIWHRKVSEISSLTNRPALRMETEWRDVPVEQAPSETNSDLLDIPDFMRNQKNLAAERLKDSTKARCDDCPPIGYPTEKTRCAECPRLNTGEGQS